MEIVPVDVRFDYCVKFIPHRGRTAGDYRMQLVVRSYAIWSR